MDIQIMARDIEICLDLKSIPYMTTDQIRLRHWNKGTGVVGPKKACGRRLSKLNGAGIIRYIEQPVLRAEPTKSYIWTLDKGGAELVSAELGIDSKEVDWKPKKSEGNYPFLNHLLHTTDLHIAVSLACDRAAPKGGAAAQHGAIQRDPGGTASGRGIALIEWHDEKMLKSDGMKDYVRLISSEGKWYQAAVVPDSVFYLQHNEKRALFFLEVDESNVTVSPTLSHRRGWTRRVQTYLTYFGSAAYVDRYGMLPARVLTVTTTTERLQHLKKATEDEGGGINFLFALFEDATDPDKLLAGKIWNQAKSDEQFCLIDDENEEGGEIVERTNHENGTR